MPKYTQELQYNIKTTFDKSGIAQLQSQLKALESTLKTSSGSSGVNIYSDKKAQQDLKNIQAVSNALTKAYSSQTGLLNVGKFTSTLQKSNVSIQQFAASCSSMGIAGQQAFNSLMGQTLSLQSGLKQTTTLAEKMKTTFSNTLRWGIASGAFQEITSTLQSAVSYVQRLDESLTQITMVSGESRDNMKEFASYANKAAASLAASTTTYTNAVKVFIQEGFSLEQSKQQATQAVTLANVSEQDSATTADQITAYRNAFGLSINDMNTTLDKIANLANNTASNVGELMVASQRSASTASSVGASQESFLAAIATIESVTRDSAENIGNGLKSIYTRFADIKMGNSTDDDVNLATYSKALKSAGVNIVDSEGQYKGFDQIFTELQAQWQNLSQTQKLAVGETVAGRYQYNRFAALMNNQDYYEKAYAATQNADGAMEAMQKAYEEGLEAQLQKMSTNMETLFTSIYNTGIVENVVGALTDFTDVLSGLFDNIDNSLPIISAFVGLIAKLGGTQFAQSVTNAMVNRDTSKNTAIAKAETAKLGNQFAASDLADEDIQRFITSSTAINTNRKLYSEEEIAASTDLQNTFVESRNKRIQLVKEQAEKERKLFELLNDVDKVPDEVFTEEQRLTLGKFQRQIDAGINPDFGTSMSDMLSSVAEKAYGAEAIQKAQKMGNKDASRVQALIDKLTGYQSRYGNESDNPNAAMLKRSVTNLRSGRKGYGYEAIIAPTEAKDVLKQFTDNAKNLRGEEYENAFKEMIVSLTQVRAGFEETQVMSKTAMRNMSSDAQLAVGAIQNLETAEIQANEALKQMQEIGSLRAKISAFTEAVGNVSIAIMGISTAVEGVKQAWDTFSDSEATVQEKSEALLEVFIQMTMTLGSLGPLLGQVFTDAKQLEAEQEVQRTQENLQKAQQEVETALGGKEIAESAGKNATKAAGEEAAEIAIEGVDDLADAVKDNTLAARDGEVATKALTVATEGAAAAEKATAGADAIDTATDIGDIAGDVIGGGKGASKSKGVLGRLFGGNGIKAAGSVLSRLAIPAAAVGLGYFATTKVDELTSSNSTKAQGLSDDTTTLKTAATSVEEEASDLANSFTTLTSNQETLKSLTQGTSEWRDQIKEINSEVSELLEKYPQLAEYVTNTNGVMSISQEGMDKYTEETESRALSASNVAAIMAKNSKTASLEADTEEMIKDSIWGGLGGRVAATAAAGAAGGAWAGGIPGAAIGGGVGAAAGALEYLWEFNDKTAEYTSQIENLADEFNSGSTDMTQWTQQVSDLSHTMGVSQAELTELIQGLAENSAALEENTTSLQTQYGAVDANAGEISWIGEQFNEDNWNEFDSGKSYNSDFIKQFVADTYGNGDTTNVSKIFEEDGEIKASMVGSSEAVTVASSVDNLRAMINAATGEEMLREVSDKSKEYLDAASVLGKDGVKPEITADSIIDQVLSSYGMADDIINNGTKESIIALSDYSNELSTHYSELNATGDQALNATTSLEDLTNALDMTTASLDFFQEKIKENYDKTADDKSLDPNDEIIAGSDLEKQKAQALVDNAEAQAIATDKQRQVDDIYTNLRDNRGLTDQGQGLLDSAANKLSEGLTVNDLEGGELTAYSSFEDTIGELVELKKAQAEANKTFEETQETVNRTTSALEEYDNSIERITQSALDSKQGFKNLASTMKSYYDILSKKAKGEDVSASDYADAMGKTQEYLKQAMQISSEDLEDMGGERFILDNLDNIKAAAGGSETALHALQTAAVKALTSSKSALKAFGSDTKTLQSDFMNLASYLQGLDLDVGGTLSMDASPAKAALGNLTSMTVKQAQIMQQVLSGIGFEGQFEYTVGGKAYTSLTEAQKALSELTANDTAGIGYTITAKLKNVKNTSSAKDLSTNDTGDSGGSSGGGGSKASKTKNSIDLDPYQEVNAQLQRQQKILDKLNASYDRLYGKARIKNIQKQLTAERKYMTLLQKEAAIANAQLKQNTKLKRDPETGDKTIKNYIGSGKGKRKNLINSDGSINQKAYEAIARELFKKKGKNTKYENFISAVEAYNSDYEKVQEMLSTIDDAYAEYFETLLKQQDYVQELRKRTDDLNESYYNLKNTIASTVDDLVSDVVSAHNKITTSANDVDLANRQKATADANLADLENQNDLLDSTKVKYNKKSYTLRQLMTKYNNATNAKTKGQLASLIEKTAKANGFAYSNLDDLNSAWVEALQDQGDKAEDVLKAYSSKVESILDAINSV